MKGEQNHIPAFLDYEIMPSSSIFEDQPKNGNRIGFYQYWPDPRFKEIKESLRRKKFHTTKAPVFAEVALAIKTMQEPNSIQNKKTIPNGLTNSH